MSRTGSGTSLVVLVAATAIALPAAAYERTLDPASGKPISWPSACFTYSINAKGYSGIDFADLDEIARAAFDAWEDVGCSSFRFEATAPATADRAEFSTDHGNANLLVWREAPGSWPYSRSIIALTSVNFDERTEEILDADIELNGVDYAFGALPEDQTGETSLIDVQSTLTHEIGHMVGLDHSPAPEATMAPYGEPGSIGKRTLHEDDVNGLCDVYPAGDGADACEEPYCGLDLKGTSDTCRRETGDSSSGCVAAAFGHPSRPSLLAVLSSLLG